jgi:exopolyphosphatase/pppGpp-phosphohydrolase
MLRMHPEIAGEVRAQWRATIVTERNQRLTLYRERMVGRQSLWSDWRADLPAGEALERAAIDKMRLWASLLDPHFEHANRVSSLALQLYDGLSQHKVIRVDRRQRAILEAAALMHDIGRNKQDGGHRKRGFRMVQKVAPPPGWSAEDMKAVAIIGRYHRGTIAPSSDKMFQGMPAAARKQVLRSAGILRLANALALATQPQDARPTVAGSNGLLVIAVPGLDLQVGRAGERLAQAKYLLEATSAVTIKFESAASPGRTASLPRRMVREKRASSPMRGR